MIGRFLGRFPRIIASFILGALAVSAWQATVYVDTVIGPREAAARQALADQGLEDAPLEVRVDCTVPADCHSGTSVVTVVIGTRVDLPFLPDLLGAGEPSFALDAAHSVPVGRYQEVSVP